MEESKQSFRQEYTDHVELSIFNCGHEHCRPGHTWGPGIRDHYLIHLVVAGQGRFLIEGKEYRLGPGDLFLVKPNQLVTYSADKEDPWEYYWVGFNGACANRLVQQTPFRADTPVYHGQNVPLLQQSLYNIYLARGLDPHSEAMMVGHLYIFISHMIREAQALEPRSGNPSSQYVLNAIKYIQFYYSHDISIDDIASSVGVSRSHLYRVFMTNVGQSPIEYLTSYRIAEACHLLKTGKLSVAEVAVSVGFFDQFYFSRVFKKQMGVPPSRYAARLEKDSRE